ncbi:M42 family metallopeptidase [Intestinibacillus sp. Marseille-P6563]|mgnify:FL=1|uniref:M42 family metallopeptidase n=1 Tax=Intestinibacillus sp. Marseille-P6563 TaxID=2364792 RepID=UPI000F04A626|nr:M20/M25/M40 family metallo-hydrolase [Intestinibacillus sp. Marseille-P6563]
MNQIETLEKLCALPGVTGFEQSAARTVAEMLRPLVNKVDIDPFGTVTGILVCPRPKAKTVLLDAHLDQIGFIVTEVLEGGFLRFMPVGGVDPRMLLGCEVTILTPTPLYGIVSCTPPHLMQPGDADKAVPIHEMLIDTGLLDAASRIPVGTPIVFRQPLVRLGKDAVSSKCLDDRAGVLAILQALKKIDRKKLGVHVAVMFSAQEEITSLGAMTGTFRLRPDYAIAVDVSHAKTPDAPADETFAFGGGVMIGMGPNMNTALTRALIRLARAEEIDYQIEVMEGDTGTNAWTMQIAACGTAQAILSIPLRYMHTPIETMHLSDLDATADLIASFVQHFDGEVSL